MTADHTATRILSVLELLQTHGRLSGAELSDRLQVDRRTVRRYIQALEGMGIPITAERGKIGGYELVAGFKLPPMMFTNDEVLAIALGLAAVRDVEPAHAVDVVRAKLERVMPENLKRRMRAIGDSVEFRQRPGAAGNILNPECLSLLSSCAHARQGVHLRYKALASEESERDFDPYGLVFTSNRWYTAGYCHLREGLRTFRLDRVESITPQPRDFERPAQFDVAAHLERSIALLPRAFAIEVQLQTDLESARRELFGSFGVLEPTSDGAGVVLRSQADDLDWFGRELLRLPWRFSIRTPEALKESVIRQAEQRIADLTRA
jgi:predicted DNA-binding transcriptional regulator YafY